jgi:hypothetical protein
MELTKSTKRRLKVFFKFLAERQNIWKRRASGKKFPWTKDKILRDNKFTNIYRELDAGTIFWFRDVLGSLKEWQSHNDITDSNLNQEILFSTCIYRLVNRVETFQRVAEPAPISTMNGGNKEWLGTKEWLEQFDTLPDPRFTGAHIVAFGPGVSKADGFKQAVKQLDKALPSLWEDIQASGSLEQVWMLLQQIKGIGGFISYEIVCDLIYANVIPFDINSWCNPGPGCIQGSNIILMGDRRKQHPRVKTRDEYIHFCKFLRKNQYRLMKECGWGEFTDFPYWDGKGVEGVRLVGQRKSKEFPHQLSLRSIEHSLCEFQKYWRCLREGGKAKNSYKESGREVV